MTRLSTLARPLPCQPCSGPQLEWILWTQFTWICWKTVVSHTLSPRRPVSWLSIICETFRRLNLTFPRVKVTKHLLSHGVLVVPWLGFHVLVEVVPTGLAKLLLETCAEVVVCLPQPRPGEDGIATLTSIRDVTPFALPLLLLESPHWSCLKVSLVDLFL